MQNEEVGFQEPSGIDDGLRSTFERGWSDPGTPSAGINIGANGEENIFSVSWVPQFGDSGGRPEYIRLVGELTDVVTKPWRGPLGCRSLTKRE